MINLIGKKAQIACELLCCCSMAYAQSNDNSEVVVLNTGWEFSQAGTELCGTHDFSGGEINRFVRNEMIDIIAVKLSDMIKE